MITGGDGVGDHVSDWPQFSSLGFSLLLPQLPSTTNRLEDFDV